MDPRAIDSLPGLSDFSPTAIFISLVAGIVGGAFFMYGKKQQRLPQVVGGIALMVYPYFVTSGAWMIVVGAGILAAMAGAIRNGA